MNFRPLTQWPRPNTKNRRGGTFRVGYVATLKLLESEIDKVGGRNAVLQAGFAREDIRNDGFPRAKARPAHPGIVVSFESRHGSLMFACDTFEDWEDNLRAVALTLENLRAVERYGATKHGEQYTGYVAIPAKDASNGFHSAEEAARFIMAAAGVNGEPRNFFNDTEDARAAIIRKAAANMHPDSGGSHEQFVKLQSAKKLLEAGVA